MPDVPKKKFQAQPVLYFSGIGLRRYVSVCLSCRKTWKASIGGCCATPERYNVSGTFKSPGKHDDRLWRRLAFILRNGLHPSRSNLTAPIQKLQERHQAAQVEAAKYEAYRAKSAAESAVQKALEPPPEPPPCKHCGFPKKLGHTGRRGKFKCCFDHTHYEPKEESDAPKAPRLVRPRGSHRAACEGTQRRYSRQRDRRVDD